MSYLKKNIQYDVMSYRASKHFTYPKELIEMKTFCKTLAITALVAAAAIAVPATAEAASMYRLYNPYSGEHFYTASTTERDHLDRIGWNYEGVGWDAPDTGDDVYRLYNPNAGDHHYTLSTHERDVLVGVGWTYEGVGWKSANPKDGVPLYRQYNPYASSGSHNYTTSKTENDYLASIGWNAEGIGWYGTKQSASAGNEGSKNANNGSNANNNAGNTGGANNAADYTASLDNLWWRSQATSVDVQAKTQRVYYLNDTNQPGDLIKVLELGPENHVFTAIIYTRETPDTTETYIEKEAWDEELYHYESRVYCPYTNQYFKDHDEYMDWWSAGGYEVSKSYNNVSVKVHDGWKHHDAGTATRTVPGKVNQKVIDFQ